jgi:hypothetical protein
MIFFVVLFLKTLGFIYTPFVLSWMSRCINLSTLDVRLRYNPRQAARIKINSWFSQIGKVCDCHSRLNPNRQLSLRIPLWDLCRTGINLLVRSLFLSQPLDLPFNTTTSPRPSAPLPPSLTSLFRRERRSPFVEERDSPISPFLPFTLRPLARHP